MTGPSLVLAKPGDSNTVVIVDGDSFRVFDIRCRILSSNRVWTLPFPGCPQSDLLSCLFQQIHAAREVTSRLCSWGQVPNNRQRRTLAWQRRLMEVRELPKTWCRVPRILGHFVCHGGGLLQFGWIFDMIYFSQKRMERTRRQTRAKRRPKALPSNRSR